MKMPPFDPVEYISPGLVVTVEVSYRNMRRFRLGLWLIWLAGRVLRCPISVERVERPYRGPAVTLHS